MSFTMRKARKPKSNAGSYKLNRIDVIKKGPLCAAAYRAFQRRIDECTSTEMREVLKSMRSRVLDFVRIYDEALLMEDWIQDTRRKW